MSTRYVTTQQIQSYDRLAIERYGIPSIILMENAGRAVAEEVLRDLRRRKQSRVAVVCGMGNNAGDGFVAARHLWNAGVDTTVFLIGRQEQLKQDAAINFFILKKCGYPVRKMQTPTTLFKKYLAETDIIIDAIFGVGLNREIMEPYRGAIIAINDSRRPVVAVDIPSGLDGTTGRIFGVCIKAAKTISFSFPKKGFSRGQGPVVTGKVVVADIGIPKKCQISNIQ